VHIGDEKSVLLAEQREGAAFRMEAHHVGPPARLHAASTSGICGAIGPQTEGAIRSPHWQTATSSAAVSEVPLASRVTLHLWFVSMGDGTPPGADWPASVSVPVCHNEYGERCLATEARSPHGRVQECSA